ncbi:MAG: protein-L-isoaspartate O-methyltransferase [archaeon]|jgi:protein-L-isoaspartate(D-aspartate) O-methyltransferase|nr:protein-L-isoaspartate O-methyltransferase [archaeon]
MDKQGLLDSLRKKGFSEQVVSVFDKVKREDFVPQNLVGYAYEDISLPVMEGSTLSQPSTVAFMLDMLDVRDGQKILEIGSGSGYALALLSEMNPNGKIYGLELIQSLGISSKKYLQEKKNVEVFIRNGSHGLPEFAPYDRILISASCPECPSSLLSQLKDDGILVSAVKQSIIQIKKVNGEKIIKEHPGFAFVPLVPD